MTASPRGVHADVTNNSAHGGSESTCPFTGQMMPASTGRTLAQFQHSMSWD
jgi:hypothetical protein